MGKPIVYCGSCGESIREEDFEKGKAHILDGQPFCTACRPLPSGAVPVRKPPTTQIPKPSSRKTTTTHIPMARPPVPQTTRRGVKADSSRTALAVGAGLAVLVILIVIVAVASGGRKGPAPRKPLTVEPTLPPHPPEPRPETSLDKRATPTPPAKPDLPPGEILRQLEAFAASSTDPDAVLQKCDEALVTLRARPQEARIREIASRARERKNTIDADRKVTTSIEDIRKVQASDPACERREEVLRLLKATAGIAGPRRAEVETLISDYERRVREADARAAAAPPPDRPSPRPEPPDLEVVSFTLINADTDQPIPEFDPIPDRAVLNLAKLPTRNLNIRANTRPDKVGAVRFTFDGAARKPEKDPPYALEMDTKGDYNAWTPALGPHSLAASPYADSGARGPQGQELTVTFTVIDSASERILHAEDFDKGPGKFQGGSAANGGRDGTRALSISPEGITLTDIPFTPVRPSTRLRFWAKPSLDIPCLELVAWSPKLRYNFRTRTGNLRAGEWARVELRLADAHKEYDGSGPSMEGVTPGNVKLYFDNTPADTRILIDDFEIFE
jgi:hypothetical protein